MIETHFYLYTCNNLQALGEAYSKTRKEHSERFRADGFFAKERICVATKGMGTWLEHFLVQQGHVVANVEFPFIRDVIDEILSAYMSADACYQPELFKEDVLIWRLYTLLAPEVLLQDSRLAVLSAYLDAERHDSVRRYQLAQKLAQLYYDYMVFIPEKLHPEWAPKGMDTAVSDSNAWQIALWQKLCTADDGTKLVSPAEAMLRFVFAKEPLDSTRYTPMSFFGISAMAPYFLWVLHRVATVQPVNFFYLNHCDDLWDEVKAHWEKRHEIESELDARFESTLLGEFGTQGRQFFRAIMDLDTDVITHDLTDERLERWESSPYESMARAEGIPLLHDIQTRILHNTDEAKDVSVRPCAQDDSLTVHSCFNDIREIEALHDCLLQLIREYQAEGKSLTMNDIIVMAPDIARFAPAIHAVFSQGPLAGSYCISDRSVKSASLMAEAFQTIMTLYKGRFEVSRISRLLDAPPLRARFGFDDDAVQKLRDWFRKAGIRWGRDKADHGSAEASFEEYSWQYGLDRLLLKLAVDGIDAEGHDLIGFGKLNPVDTAMGQDSQHLLNGLCRFYRELREFVDDVQQPTSRNGAAWCDYLLDKRGAFFCADSTSTRDYSHLGKICSDMKAALEKAGCSETMPYEVIVSAMSSKLDAPAQGEPFLNGKITFCSLLPMRGIPCKVIALLGMDVGEFPRQNDATSYNLVIQPVNHAQKSASVNLLKYYDRSRSIEDRFTFLEALMSAQDYLMIFYKGQDDQTLDDLVAAAPVVELLNYVRKIRPLPKGSTSVWPLVKHTLNAFDPQAFATVVQTTKASETAGDASVKQPSGALLQAFSFDREMWRLAMQMHDRAGQEQTVSSDRNSMELQNDTAPADKISEQETVPVPRHEMWLDAYRLPQPQTLPHGWQAGQPLTLDLQDLIQFYRNPQDAYMTARLGLPKTAWEEEALSDYEPFALSALQAYQMKKDLAVEQLSQEQFVPLSGQSSCGLKQIFANARGRCELPTGAMAQIETIAQQIDTWIADKAFRNEWKEQETSEEELLTVPLGTVEAALPEDLHAIIKHYSNWGEAFPRPTAGTFTVTVTGRLRYLREDAKLERACGLRQCFNVKSFHGRHFNPFYLKHVFLAAAKPETKVVSIYLPHPSAKSKILACGDDDCTSAHTLLTNLVRMYLFGHLYPLPLLGKASVIKSQGVAKDLVKKDMEDMNPSLLFTECSGKDMPQDFLTLLTAVICFLFPSLERSEPKAGKASTASPDTPKRTRRKKSTEEA